MKRKRFSEQQIVAALRRGWVTGGGALSTVGSETTRYR
jgi:hypothetical protein